MGPQIGVVLSVRVLAVRDNCRRYSLAKEYKLNPAATAAKIWDHIVSIYHSSLLRRILHLPAVCDRRTLDEKASGRCLVLGQKTKAL